MGLFSFIYFTLSKKIDIVVYYLKDKIIFRIKTMNRIIVKEIDRLKSTMFGKKAISEYLIYVVFNDGDNDITLKGYTEYGEKNKNARIDELIIEYFVNNETLNKINRNEIIQEISFLEHLKN